MKLIPLTQGQFAKVSDHRYEELMQWKWHASWVPSTKSFYAARSETIDGNSKKIKMHRQIMNTPEGMVCDHINHDTLDNQDENLRNCTNEQNTRNKSVKTSGIGFKGIYLRGKTWRARIEVGDKSFWKYGFKTPEEAAKAYDELAKKHHGEFASLNFPESTGNNA